MSAGERLVLYESQIVVLEGVLKAAPNEIPKLLAEGWEPIQVHDAGGTHKMFALFKRPVPHPPPPLTAEGEVQPSGWYLDPLGREFERYFDGDFWTVHLRDEQAWQENVDHRLQALTSAQLDAANRKGIRQQEKVLTEQLVVMGEAGEVFVGEPNEDSPEGWYLDWVMPSPNRYRFWDGSSTTSTVELTSN